MSSRSNILIGTYRPEKNQLDWILGVSPKRNYMLYNIRRNADLFSNRNGGSHCIKDVNLLVLYNYHNLSTAPILYRILATADATEQQMLNLRYPEPEGSYVLYQIEELGTIADFPIGKYASEESDFEPVLVSIDALENSIQETISELSQKAQNHKTIELDAEVGKINKWDKSVPVEENMYYWKEWYR